MSIEAESLETATNHKNEGSAFWKENNFESAIESWTEAIACTPSPESEQKDFLVSISSNKRNQAFNHFTIALFVIPLHRKYFTVIGQLHT